MLLKGAIDVSHHLSPKLKCLVFRRPIDSTQWARSHHFYVDMLVLWLPSQHLLFDSLEPASSRIPLLPLILDISFSEKVNAVSEPNNVHKRNIRKGDLA